jgi:probable F420-dependent oxidoreductase
MARKEGIRFGIGIPQVSLDGAFDPPSIASFVRRAEELGYDSGWVQERMMGGLPTLDALPLLTYAAAFTSTLKLGTSVMLTALAIPIPLAKSIAALDQLSGGRAIVGVGLGGSTAAYPAFGLPAGRRVTLFEEGIRLMKSLWTEERVTFRGRFWQVDGLATNSATVQRPHPPIWFGAHSEAALRRAVRMGDGWMGAGNSTTAEFKEEISLLRRILAEEGRDPASFALSKRVYVAVTTDKRGESERTKDWFARHYGTSDRALDVSVIGAEEECVEALSQVVDEGVDLLMVNPIFDQTEQMERLSRDVLPRL